MHLPSWQLARQLAPPAPCSLRTCSPATQPAHLRPRSATQSRVIRHAAQDVGATLALSDEELSADLEAELAEAEARQAIDELSSSSQDTPAEAAAEQSNAAYSVTDTGGYKLNFVWLEASLGMAVDQIFSTPGSGSEAVSPVTPYFFWPTNDAWYEVKAEIEAKPWILELNKVLLLNMATEVINYWGEGAGETPADGKAEAQVIRHTLEDARAKFPHCTFIGV